MRRAPCDDLGLCPGGALDGGACDTLAQDALQGLVPILHLVRGSADGLHPGRLRLIAEGTGTIDGDGVVVTHEALRA